jgi:hypothetical protein
MRISIAIAAVFLFAATTLAQTTGSLRGTVSGPDGVIPNAQIVVTDNQTRREVTVQTDGDGNFLVPKLDFGTYTVTISAQGFKKFTTSDLKIDVGREYNLNPTLEVGGIEEVVTVNAGADIINGSDAELSSTVSPRQVVDLPLNGRNPLSLVSLQPGANATSNGINGQRSTAINVTRDGINVQDNYIRSGNFVDDQPTVDDTGEFTVTTQNAGVEQGGAGSSQVQLVTPRGGQDFHGAAFLFNRNSEFGANNFFNNAAGTERPFLNRNQVGFKLGGPMPFFHFGEGGPMFDKDKAFFFVAYERLFERKQSSGTNTVLLGPGRNGTFTYTDNSGVQRTVNVLTGAGLNLSTPANQTAFANAGGVLSVDPVVQSRLLSRIPNVGNFGPTADNGLTQAFRINVANNRDSHFFVTRLDYDFNDRNSVNFVYRLVDDALDRPDADFGFEPRPFVIQTERVHFLTGAYRSIINSNFTNEFRVGYNAANPFFNQDPSINPNFLINSLSIPFGVTNPEPTFEDQGRNTKLLTFKDDANYTFGDHALQFGGQIENYKIVSTANFGVIPNFAFTNTDNPETPRLASALFPGGISGAQRTLADDLRYFLGGVIGAGVVQANPTSGTSGPVISAVNRQDLRYKVIGLYAGDQWRAFPSLTLNFGLRYDLFTPIKNPDRVFLEPVIPEGADPIAAILDPNGRYDLVGTSIGKPGQLFRADKNNFAPQFGFAWSPQFKNKLLGPLFGDGRTVIRGGYRMSYFNDEYILSALNSVGGNDGLAVTVNAVDTLPDGSTTTNLNRFLRNVTGTGFPQPQFTSLPITFAEANVRDAFFNSVFAIDPKLQTPLVHEYNIGIQREIGFNTAIEIRYVGSRSTNLIRARDFNQVEIRKNGLLADFNNARFNLLNFGQADCTTAGCLPVGSFFNKLGPDGAFFGLGFTESFLEAGTPGDLAVNLVFNAPFFPNAQQLILANPNAGVVDFLSNDGKFNYNALQFEVRRRFTQGFSFQANYTFGKQLTTVPEEDQTRFDPLLDNAHPELEYSRGDLDRTHAFNLNAIYELPFGRGKMFFDQGGITNAIVGGWQISAIVQAASGTPISFRDLRGTLNRSSTVASNRSARQTAFSNLTKEQIKDLVGIFRTPNGVYFINPDVIGPDGSATNGSNTATPSNPAFPGQVFFANQPGQTGNLERGFINGPSYFNIDLGLSKRFQFNERMGLQLRAEAFNLLNRANFRPLTGTTSSDSALGENSNIFDVNSTTFGQLTNTYSPRVLQFGVRFEF